MLIAGLCQDLGNKQVTYKYFRTFCGNSSRRSIGEEKVAEVAEVARGDPCSGYAAETRRAACPGPPPFDPEYSSIFHASTLAEGVGQMLCFVETFFEGVRLSGE